MSPHSAKAFSQAEQSLLSLRGMRNVVSPSYRTAIVVTGPPGSGKSTLARTLTDVRASSSVVAYIEEADKNPYLKKRTGLYPVNASRSQEWFLRQYERAIRGIRGEVHLILDQDPRAVVLVYSRFLVSVGSISQLNYSWQINRCRGIQRLLSESFDTIYYIILNADHNIRLNRLIKRGFEPEHAEYFLRDVEKYFKPFILRLKQSNPDRYAEYDSGNLSVSKIQSDLTERFITRGAGFQPNEHRQP